MHWAVGCNRVPIFATIPEVTAEINRARGYLGG